MKTLGPRKVDISDMGKALEMTKADIEESILENVRLGYLVVVGATEHGETMFQVTPRGRAAARALRLEDEANGKTRH